MEHWLVLLILILSFILFISSCLLSTSEDSLAKEYNKVLEDLRFERLIQRIYRRK